MSDSLYHNYASALFDLVEGDRYEDYLSAVRETEKNLLEQREFLSFLSSYEIPLSDKEKAIEKIYGSLKLPYYTDFLKLLTKKHRIGSFEIISREFGELVCEKLGIIEGIIYSVEKLPAAKIHTVEDAFAKKFGKKVELKNVIEPGLIGGVKVALDGKVYDGSLRNRLMGLENTLMKSGGSR